MPQAQSCASGRRASLQSQPKAENSPKYPSNAMLLGRLAAADISPAPYLTSLRSLQLFMESGCNRKALLLHPGLFEGTVREGAACPAPGKAAAAGLGCVCQQGIRHIVLLHFLSLHLSGLVKKVHSLVGDKSTAQAEKQAHCYFTGRILGVHFTLAGSLCTTDSVRGLLLQLSVGTKGHITKASHLSFPMLSGLQIGLRQII